MSSLPKAAPKIIVVLDYPDATSALRLVDHLSPELCGLKVGKELFTAAGPAFVEKLVARGFCIFLDLKYHDIPNTVANACKAAAKLGVWMINVHALGGFKMMEAARAALDSLTGPKPLLIAVTVLTSATQEDLQRLHITQPLAHLVVDLAKLAQQAGLDGVVCSAEEVSAIRAACGTKFALVTPGIRPAGSAKDDQVRIMTPKEAIAAGSDYLVIGRPITQASEPLQALRNIYTEISN
jgi:orotidine-5'-phosphate decarboxylase